jgi:hypothetical protein
VSFVLHCLVLHASATCALGGHVMFRCRFFNRFLHQQAADEKLARAQSRLTERERQSLQAQAAVSAAWARAEA